jgi:hypothetical protein
MQQLGADLIEKYERGRRGPAWRWGLAQEDAAARSRRAVAKLRDPLVVEAAKFLRWQGAGANPRRASGACPTVAAAQEIWSNDDLRPQLQLFALMDYPREQIVDRLHVPLSAVIAAERLFFDVRPALGASDWIMIHVIMPEIEAGNPDFVVKLKVAYFGGPTVARAVLEAGAQLPVTEVQRLFDRESLLHLKFQSCMAAPVGTESERLAFLKLYFEFQEKKARLDLQKEKFREACGRRRRKAKADGAGEHEPAPTMPDLAQAVSFPRAG